tara:strand:+ start:563 stop:751 length:189 start_codon:yes stop_codon:yes gene_type:complete
MLWPDPKRNKSLNADAKQNLDFWSVKPKPQAAIQIAASEPLLPDMANEITKMNGSNTHPKYF